MRPNTNKSKTAKAGRRFRGLEVAQAAILLVLGVVVALVMYFIATNMLWSTPVPRVQLDIYNSFFHGDGTNGYLLVRLKFARAGTVTNVRILSTLGGIGTITECFSGELRVNPGDGYTFRCSLPGSNYWEKEVVVYVRFKDDEEYYIPWRLS
jgi:hypothetical protein